jgi:transposase-like protein
VCDHSCDRTSLSTRDIALHLEELYGAQVPASLISAVTVTVSEDVGKIPGLSSDNHQLG